VLGGAAFCFTSALAFRWNGFVQDVYRHGDATLKGTYVCAVSRAALVCAVSRAALVRISEMDVSLSVGKSLPSGILNMAAQF
jgi:hypothetical protein